MAHPSLAKSESVFIGGEWRPIPGDTLQSRNPARLGQIVWSGAPAMAQVAQSIASARTAQPAWEAWTFERRAAVLRTFAQLATARVDALTNLLRDEVGKPTWDARAEAQLLANKVEITLDSGASAALRRVEGFECSLTPSRSGGCWFRPHGVMAVLGPFNFPAHLPNGHIVPALAMGNTVVFKPSDKAPGAGQLLAELYQEALDTHNAPAGVFNLVQGGGDIAAALANHEDVDGVLFTGSWAVGRRIMEANLDRPGKLLALEMGGNNPALIMDDADATQAVIECVRCAFITSGQRCTCTRRLIVHERVAERVIAAVVSATRELTIGDPAAWEGAGPFMGPVISLAARAAIFESYQAMISAGGRALVEMRMEDAPAGAPGPGAYVTPGVVQVERFVRGAGTMAERSTGKLRGCGDDIEVFGPLLRISICRCLEDGIEQAAATDFGLAAAIFTTSEANARAFRSGVRAGCTNWNTGTAGASSKLPFGGLGVSGNHRPAGAFSLDYCAYPVAGMTERGNAALVAPGMPPIKV